MMRYFSYKLHDVLPTYIKMTCGIYRIDEVYFIYIYNIDICKIYWLLSQCNAISFPK